jgi:beta-lactam-binding protein with PASTA domain
VLNPKQNQDVGGFGGGKGATIWHDAMAPILSAQAMVPFPPADPTVQNGNTRIVPSCNSVGRCESALQAAGFQSDVQEVDSDQPDGTVIGTSPPAGSRAVVNQVITIQVSNGSLVPAPAPEPPAEPEEPEDDGEGDEGDEGDGGNGNGNGNGNNGQVQVPEVRGQQIDQAENTLRSQGFDVRRDGDGDGDDLVSDQQPPPGQFVPPGTQIVLRA